MNSVKINIHDDGKIEIISKIEGNNALTDIILAYIGNMLNDLEELDNNLKLMKENIRQSQFN